MTDRSIDPERTRKPVSDKDAGYSGEDYDRLDERRLAADMPAGSVAPTASRVGSDPAAPRDAGKRASFDPVTGEVRGSGAGAGGGNPGEDPDSDAGGGDGAPITGAGTPKS